MSLTHANRLRPRSKPTPPIERAKAAWNGRERVDSGVGWDQGLNTVGSGLSHLGNPEEDRASYGRCLPLSSLFFMMAARSSNICRLKIAMRRPNMRNASKDVSLEGLHDQLLRLAGRCMPRS